MTDIVTPEKRSNMMSGIRGRDTSPEMIVRSGLHMLGVRFRINRKDLPGTPDLVLSKFNAVIFVHGCFWHRHKKCPYAYNPKSQIEFWQKKFDDNVKRDKRCIKELRKSGWRILVIWECYIRKKPDNAVLLAYKWLSSNSVQDEIG